MFVPQATIVVLPIKIHVTTRLLVYGNGVPILQPRKVNSYPRPSGEPLGGSPNGGSPGGGSFDRNPARGLPPNPHVRIYGWQALDPMIFMPPSYQPVLVLSKPTSKLPYQKLQYPTYVKDINPNDHIRVFKKTIRANGEIVEANIINLFSFILQDCISKWGENFVQDHLSYTFDELEQAFCKCF